MNMSSTRSKQQGSTLVGIFVGLVLGVVIAAGVVWYLNRSHSPFQNNKDSSLVPAEKGKGAASGAAESLPAKPGEKPRFDFYNILPGGQDAAPAPKAAPPEAAIDANEATERFFLQAGAFQKKADADNLKGELALLGIEASVTEVNIPEKGKMYRVRSGPYGKAEEMNRVRTQMSQGGVQATVVKVKE